MRDVSVSLLLLVGEGEFGGGIFRENSWEGVDFGVEFAAIGEHLVSAQRIFRRAGFEPSGDTEAVVVFERGVSGSKYFSVGRLGHEAIDFILAGIDEKS